MGSETVGKEPQRWRASREAEKEPAGSERDNRTTAIRESVGPVKFFFTEVEYISLKKNCKTTKLWCFNRAAQGANYRSLTQILPGSMVISPSGMGGRRKRSDGSSTIAELAGASVCPVVLRDANDEEDEDNDSQVVRTDLPKRATKGSRKHVQKWQVNGDASTRHLPQTVKDGNRLYTIFGTNFWHERGDSMGQMGRTVEVRDTLKFQSVDVCNKIFRALPNMGNELAGLIR
ncbi:hypothetical protein F4604DRAFT_1683008 [Suillus subluteus]|nr:hypothetical protein F4604DRAFT_1683008 [Suillus subluteus]